MSFTRSSLGRVSGANTSAPTVWVYKTADTIADCNTEDYFLDAINEIRLGDLITLITSTGSTIVATTSYFNQSDGTNIDIVDGVTITNTDGD